MAIILRNPTLDGTCSSSGLFIRHFSGVAAFRRARSRYVCELHKNGAVRTAWVAFIVEPWEPTDSEEGAWISVRSRIFDNELSCAITNAPESPIRHRDELRKLRALGRAEVFARPRTAEYIDSVGDIVLRDREVHDFLTTPRALVIGG